MGDEKQPIPLGYESPEVPTTGTDAGRCLFCGGSIERGFLASGDILRWHKDRLGFLGRMLGDFTGEFVGSGVKGAEAIRCARCRRITISY